MRRSYGSKSDTEMVNRSRQRATSNPNRPKIQFKPNTLTGKAGASRRSLPNSKNGSDGSAALPFHLQTRLNHNQGSSSRGSSLFPINARTHKASSMLSGSEASEFEEDDDEDQPEFYKQRAKHGQSFLSTGRFKRSTHQSLKAATKTYSARKRPFGDISDDDLDAEDEDDDALPAGMVGGEAGTGSSSPNAAKSAGVYPNAGKLVDLEALKTTLTSVSAFKSNGTGKTFDELKTTGVAQILKTADDLASFINDTVVKHCAAFEFAFEQGATSKAEIQEEVSLEIESLEERLGACTENLARNLEDYKACQSRKNTVIENMKIQCKTARKEHEKSFADFQATWAEAKAAQLKSVHSTANDKAGNKSRSKQLSLLLGVK